MKKANPSPSKGRTGRGGRGGAKRKVVPDGPGPWRTCVGCRAVRRPDDPEAGLVRFVRVGPAPLTESHVDRRDASNDLTAAVSSPGPFEVEISRTGRGRGAWLCRDTSTPETYTANPSCLATATKRHAFAKALRVRQ